MSQSRQSSHVLGIALVVASTFFFALAGIFTKSTSTDPWTIACWRGLIASLVIGAYVLVRRGGTGQSLRLGWSGWALAIVAAAQSALFIASFKHTYVANVAVIYATVPFMAAGIDWAVLRVAPRARTLVTALVCLIGVATIVGAGVGGDHLAGDALALAMTFCCAIYLVMIRAYPDTPAVWAGAVGSLLLFVFGWAVADPLAISGHDFLVVATFGVSFSAASILWTEGARLLPAPESGLLGTAEVPFAILFAWLILAEVPPLYSFVGGAIVLIAVLAHAGRDMLTERSVGRLREAGAAAAGE